MNHICTTRSLEAGIDLSPSKCPICKHKTLHHGWCDSNCKTCWAILGSEAPMPDNLTQIRRGAGLVRSYVAELMGVSQNTVTAYETGWCSRKYFDKFVLLIQDIYSRKQVKE